MSDRQSHTFMPFHVEGGIIDAHEFENDPDILTLLAFYVGETQNHHRECEENEIWSQFKICTLAALNAYLAGDLERTAWSFYQLGRTVQILESEAIVARKKAARTTRTLQARQRSTRSINFRKKKSKWLAQGLAESLWKENTMKTTRTAEMAEIVWNRLTDLGFNSILPVNSATGLIPWLREIAPPDAKRPGRPKKS